MTDTDRISEADLLAGFKHLVKNSDYMGGHVSLLEKRISVSQILEELGYGLTPSQLAQTYNIPLGAISEALKFAGQVSDNPNVEFTAVEDAF